MIRFVLVCFALVLPAVAMAQSNVKTKQGDVVQLRALDTITGLVEDIDLPVGDTTVYERLMVSVKECRYPAGNISADAFAYLVIRDVRETLPAFEGWMIASSPALSALEHPRYDVWVLRCMVNE
ncbi:DUF2155 domain-containing protein [Amylibacter sp. IMCC11727]|uniref:DUF2155 domain-containing protein n=1 Tax=Amylibacter sp. IMCC11727 TaxID=3039851 RepID=UPI00244DCDF7|nr:DUF2155 domain-containing protein [Amylibacter sp. IMCC11727]WGI20588.1 DUF2155 domain-containing protein [Amylibacter sp. IMCC11727]